MLSVIGNIICMIVTLLYAIIAGCTAVIAVGLYSIIRIFIGGKIGKKGDLYKLDSKDS